MLFWCTVATIWPSGLSSNVELAWAGHSKEAHTTCWFMRCTKWALKYCHNNIAEIIRTGEWLDKWSHMGAFVARRKKNNSNPSLGNEFTQAGIYTCELYLSIWCYSFTQAETPSKGPCVWPGIFFQDLPQPVCLTASWTGTCIQCMETLEKTLIPFVQKVYPNSHHFMADNNPKHNLIHTKKFLVNNIKWWCTPAESPDLNPIENLWHELKEHIHWEKKPQRKEGKVEGINKFRETVNVNERSKYIHHVHQVTQNNWTKWGASWLYMYIRFNMYNLYNMCT